MGILREFAGSFQLKAVVADRLVATGVTCVAARSEASEFVTVIFDCLGEVQDWNAGAGLTEADAAQALYETVELVLLATAECFFVKDQQCSAAR